MVIQLRILWSENSAFHLIYGNDSPIISLMGHFFHHRQQLQLPHCSVLLLGLHCSGRPALLIADAGYLSVPLNGGDPLPLSFTPVIDSEELPTKKLSYKDKLAEDQVGTASSTRLSWWQHITLIPSDGEQSWGGVVGRQDVRYDRPKEPSKKEKHVLLMRAGESDFPDC